KTLPENPENLLFSYIDPKAKDAEEQIDEINRQLSVSSKTEEEDQPAKEGPVTLYPQFESDITVEELMEYIPGPDFPTACQIYNRTDIETAYATGRGRVLIRAKAGISETASGKFQIIITEIPYQVNKAHMIEKIADLVKDKRIEGISDLRDESNREGIRVVVDLKKSAQPKAVLNKLYKYTEMQKAFNANMIALVDGQPRILTLKQILEHFVSHRITVVIRRFEFNLAQAKYRGHILEGLKKALDHLDEVIKTIRESKTQENAKENLIAKFDFSEVQAQAILDMQLRRLAALERQKIEDEYEQVLKQIEELEALLSSPDKILGTIKSELLEVKEVHGDERRTKVFKGKVDEIEEEDMIAEEETLVTVSNSGYVKRMPPSMYKVQKRGGKGIIGATTKEGDYIEHAITCSTLDTLVLFTNQGRAFESRVYEIPEFGRTAKGIPLVNLIQLDQDEEVTALLSRSSKGLSDEDQLQENQGEGAEAGGGKETDTKTGTRTGKQIDAKTGSRAGTTEIKGKKQYKYLLMATRAGNVKKTEISQFDGIRANGLISIKLDKDDELKWVKPTTGENEIVLVTKLGRSIRFGEKDIRPTGRATRGVRGIAFKKEGDEVISMDIIRKEEDMVLTISENGYGKMTPLDEYPLQKRAGQGVFTFRVNDKTGDVTVARILDHPDRELVLISRHGQIIRSELKEIPKLRRQTSGVRVMRLNKEDTVAAMALME
ncbi:MAG: hypothetical protein GXY53_08070, partial [Desulfobulbus sp.]|nr:hypothetical protein [Desulfobulbus sp.]